MPRIVDNADIYASQRQNIWFPAHNSTPADGNLTGQCVTLEKWFLSEMTEVPSPFSARGHGKDVGRTLVNQGHAIEVTFAQRQRGDIICYEYGTYGHVAIQLSGGRVFESNVNLGGVNSKIVDGERVYASRIGSENEAWRQGKNPHVYRVKTYSEENNEMRKPTYKEVLDYFTTFIDGPLTEAQQNYYVARGIDVLLSDLLQYNYDMKRALRGNVASLTNQVQTLTKQINDMGNRPTKEQMETLQKQLEAANKIAAEAKASYDKIAEERQNDINTGNSFLRWLGNILKGVK